MRKNIRLICFVFGMMLLITGLLLSIYNHLSTNEEPDYMNDSIEYWNDILKKNESDISYIIQWINDNKNKNNLSSFKDGSGDVHYTIKDKYMPNMDNRITDFVKDNSIDVVKSEKEISFKHVFFEKKCVKGNYVLIYLEDEKLAKDSYHKIKNDYYCKVIFYE